MLAIGEQFRIRKLFQVEKFLGAKHGHILIVVVLPRKQFRAVSLGSDRRGAAKMSAQRNRRPTVGADAFVGVCDGGAGVTCRGVGRGWRFFTFTASCCIM
jgi:hypothetical protein